MQCFSRRLVTHIKPGASKITSPTFILKFDDEIPPKEECKIYFVIERKNTCIDSSAKQSIQYSILTTQKTGITIKYFTFICNSEIFTFTQKKVNTKTPIEIVFQREGDFYYVDDYYVLVFCDYNFNIFDNSNPRDFCPKEENPHIVFTNNSSKHPYIAKPIRTKTKNGKTFLDFNSSYHNTKSENERVLTFISKLGNISDSSTSSLSNQQEMKKNNENSSYIISSTDDYSSDFEEITSDDDIENISCSSSDIDDIIIDEQKDDDISTDNDDEQINVSCAFHMEIRSFNFLELYIKKFQKFFLFFIFKVY